MSTFEQSPLVRSLIELYEVYQAALDEDFNPSFGRAPFSEGFTPFQMMIANHCQQDWRMLYDTSMKRADGTPMLNIRGLIEKQHKDIREYIDETYIQKGLLEAEARNDTVVNKMLDRLYTMEEQERVIEESLGAYQLVFKHFFKRDWQPYIPNEDRAQATSAKADRRADRLAKLLPTTVVEEPTEETEETSASMVPNVTELPKRGRNRATA